MLLQRDQFVLLLRRQTGFLDFEVVPTGPDSGVATLWWESEQARSSATPQLHEWVTVHLDPFFLTLDNACGPVVMSTRSSNAPEAVALTSISCAVSNSAIGGQRATRREAHLTVPARPRIFLIGRSTALSVVNTGQLAHPGEGGKGTIRLSLVADASRLPMVPPLSAKADADALKGQLDWDVRERVSPPPM